MTNITSLSLTTLAAALDKRELSSREITEAHLAAIFEKEPDLGAFLTILQDTARQAADRLDTRRISGEKLPFSAGIPMALKDNICTQGVRTTCASRMLENFVPPYNATVAEKLSDCILVGKTNMDEFAMGSSTENSAFHITRNPRDLSCVPGGSSGGSAAAVAANEIPFALGSDTGGSVRQPAAFCGIVGCKPTYGTVSRYGLVAFASSLDQIGTLTRNVNDCSHILAEIMGRDARDATSQDTPSVLTDGIDTGIRGMRIGLVREMSAKDCAPEVAAAYRAACEALTALGAELTDISLPTAAHALPAYYIISSAEASSNLARYDGVRFGHRAEKCESLTDMYCRSRSEGFGTEVKRRIMMGAFVLKAGHADAFYKKAAHARRLLRAEFDTAFQTCDILLTPTAPTLAYKLKEKSADPLAMYHSDIFTVPVNLAGLPAISIPFGDKKGGLSAGMQLIAPAFSEAIMLRVAYALEAYGKEGAK